MPTIRAVLNRLKWSTEGGLSDCEVFILHRGAPGNLRSIQGRCIKDVAPRALICEEDGEETLIPYHRVRLIKKGAKTVWAKAGMPLLGEVRGKGEDEEDDGEMEGKGKGA